MSLENEIISSIALNQLSGLGSTTAKKLIDVYKSAVVVLEQNPKDWPSAIEVDLDLDMIKSDIAACVPRAHADLEMARSLGVKIYLSHLGPYPDLLKASSVPPMVLYVLGDDISIPHRAIAIVGSRACTHYGEKMAKIFSREFAAAGITTISGLARGIDTHVHQSTLAEGGRTYAVVGSGLMMTYPAENRELAEKIATSGAVISEFPMATKPHPSHFPRRNRIIAAMSQATMVIEGGETSGSLITARLAAQEGREVFALPGPVSSSQSKAPHRLIKQGASLVEEAWEVMEALKWNHSPSLKVPDESREWVGPMKDIIEIVNDVPIGREELMLKLNIDASFLATSLVKLETEGLIKSLPGGRIVRS